ncbi:fibrinogen-binding protein [Agrobacterium tumefaciens]|uniref:Fibrinogen-binding protein n=1 Tax=Agrobacterium tumefaciens TaxID=358 RepID=A0AA44J847_AGRTU|nr:fibrinogen-binding protein [Agrobacterium tumefaciens]NSL20906.1 fibrinogen-binding protein [Agrobacterium tumefaciens]NSY50005.1 fibrinogen-binding protein [Agrobacterium tumefaciens]NTB85370.1 fibrinogen-binding protein [Agrobacterium tumefaciens]NTC17907.1 fibrinogen-binding protein [Agrobacterium tumefaciens]NTC28420.1 fibrinogen-binding protein [Agrobacterium tumefaciens]
MGYNPQPAGDDITKIGALSEGFANTSTNDATVDDSNVGTANGENRNNDNSDNSDNSNNSTNVDVDAQIDVAVGNGDNRDNDYDWSYDSKSYSDNDTTTKTSTETNTEIKSDYDWSYESKSYSDNDINVKTVTDTDTKTFSYSDNDTSTTTTATSGSFNSADSFYKSDDDFGNIAGVKDVGNLGIAGGDLTFNLGDDFSFTLDVDNILNSSLNGEGNDTGFSLVQANHLADQDQAWDVRMDNGGAQNHLSANAGDAFGAEGMDGKGWDLKAGDDAAGTSTADASAILANSGFHLELVQGANMLSNAVDISVTGGNSHVSDTGEDSGS